jgi:hypothetical protein
MKAVSYLEDSFTRPRAPGRLLNAEVIEAPYNQAEI